MGPRRQPLIINRSYSTTPTGRTKKPWTDAMNVLYNRISSLADQRITISLFLNHWVLEGQPVNKNQLREFIKELRFHKRYAHALEVYIYVCVCVCVCVWCVHTEIGFDWTQWVLENNQFDCLMSVCYFLYSFLFLYLGYREEDNEGQKHIVWSFWFGPKCLIIDLFEKQVL